MDFTKIYVNRFRLFFIYSIDLGHLLASDADIQSLQNLRAKDELYELICHLFDNAHITASTFNDPCLETEKIRARTNSAVSKGGKNIWSDLFFKKQVPICFKKEQGINLSPAISAIAGTNIVFHEKNKTKDIGIRFEECNLRIFREGTLSFTFEFSRDSQKPGIYVNDFINTLDKLEAETFNGYVYRIKQVLRDWSNSSHAFQKLNIKIGPLSGDTDTIIRTQSVKHSCLFLENVNDITSKKEIPVGDPQSKLLLLGILNKARWYQNYGDKYIENAFNKNVGYRRDEIYLTDKDSSLILLADYWNPEKPLQHYIYDLMLALELQISKLAYLNFVLHYMQANPLSREALSNPSGENAIKLVLQTRSILTLAQESIDINTFIVHGFTRSFIGQLTKERNLTDHLDSIERRVENINGAIGLKSSIDFSKQGVSLSKRGVWWAIAGVILAAVFSFISVFIQYILPWIKDIVNQIPKTP